MARDYNDEDGARLVDINGDTFEIRATALAAVTNNLRDVREQLTRMRERPFASACGEADALEDREQELRRELANLNALGTDAETCGRCGQRSDWHDATDGSCPDDDEPHPYSLAAECPDCEAVDKVMREGGTLPPPCPRHS
jgi:hypothetical protein